jgi:hypothetical protein
MVATLVLETSAEMRVGSSPTWGTTTWLRSSVRQNVGLQNQMSVVRIHPGSPKIWAVGIVGNTVALQASVPGSNPGRSTKG